MSQNLSDGKPAKPCAINFTKRIWLPVKLSLLRGSCPKSAWASRKHLAHTVSDFVQIGSLSAEL